MKTIKYINKYIIGSLLLGMSACNYLDIEPVGQVIPEKTSEYRALLTSAYSKLPSHKRFLTVRSDELQPIYDEFGFTSYSSYKDIAIWNDVTPDPKTYEFPWVDFYTIIFYTNEIITNGPEATDDNSEPIAQILGEAYALRAYMYFELLNMYAPVYDKNTAATQKTVPLTTKIDIEQHFPKSTMQEVYNQIESDLENADKYMITETQPEKIRYRFSRESLLVMKARIALYKGNASDALIQAKAALEINSQLEDLNTEGALTPVNYKSKEAIQSMERILDSDFGYDFTVSNALISLYNENDLRLSFYYKFDDWTGYTVNKCITIDERVTFRRSEVYLIAAEAAATEGHLDIAANYLKTLIKNRLKPAYYESEAARLSAIADKNQMLKEIAKERQRELAMEGHRWYDLRRTTQEQLTKELEGQTYILQDHDTRYTLRIPQSAIEANPDLKN